MLISTHADREDIISHLVTIEILIIFSDKRRDPDTGLFHLTIEHIGPIYLYFNYCDRYGFGYGVFIKQQFSIFPRKARYSRGRRPWSDGLDVSSLAAGKMQFSSDLKALLSNHNTLQSL